MADLSLGKPLDHIPDLGAVLVGPLIEGVRRTGRGSIKLHLRIVMLVNVVDIFTINTVGLTSFRAGFGGEPVNI